MALFNLFPIQENREDGEGKKHLGHETVAIWSAELDTCPKYPHVRTRFKVIIQQRRRFSVAEIQCYKAGKVESAAGQRRIRERRTKSRKRNKETEKKETGKETNKGDIW